MKDYKKYAKRKREHWMNMVEYNEEIKKCNNNENLVLEKPMLNTEQQIEHLKKKGITFNICSEEEAYKYLRYNNNYFKLSSYRKNYDQIVGGKNDGKYLNLDFGYLRDLAIIDMKLRYTIVQLALDIEHYAKMEILRLLEDNEEDGYSIRDDFFNSISEIQLQMTKNEINRNENTTYCGDLFKRYPEKFPVWVFLEMIPFGRMVSFYKFCADRYSSNQMENNYFLLKVCKEVRNASAHSSCILNNLRMGTKKYNSRYPVMRELSKIKEISTQSRDKRMSNSRMQQIITLLYTYNKIVTSDGVKCKAKKILKELQERMIKNSIYYDKNDMIMANFKFLSIVIDNWY